MTSQTRAPLTRGPLPARVYWRRRLAVLSIALLLVLGLGRLLGGGSDGSSDGDGRAALADAPTAASTAATTSATTSATASPAGDASSSGEGKRKGRKDKGASAGPTAPTTTPPPPPAEPDGPCADSDIAVTPEVGEAIAGPRHGVVISLQLRTITDEACTWKVSPSTLSVKITSGADDIWSSRECPRVLPSQQVTVRQAESTTITLAWNARRSDEECSRLTEYAMPGWYHVSAAALAGEPSETQFELVAPQPAVVTQTADPHQGKGKKGKKNR